MNENALDLIRSRRTIRKFSEQAVSKEQIETLVELGMCAPTRLERKPWAFVVIQDRELQERIAKLLRVHPYLETASAVIAVCAQPKRAPTWAMDASAAIENMLLAATAMDLGAAWVGAPDTALWDSCEDVLRQALMIPSDVRIVSLVAVGHPAQQLPAHGRHDRFEQQKLYFGRWGNTEPG